jgi:hypothetical protein
MGGSVISKLGNVWMVEERVWFGLERGVYSGNWH